MAKQPTLKQYSGWADTVRRVANDLVKKHRPSKTRQNPRKKPSKAK